METVRRQINLETNNWNVFRVPVAKPDLCFFATFQVNDVNFENMSNDDAVRVLREIVSKPG